MRTLEDHLVRGDFLGHGAVGKDRLELLDERSALGYPPGRQAGWCLAELRADAWVVVAPRREVAEWLVGQPVPAIALGGGNPDVNVAATGTLASPARVEALRRLLELGHRRIVLICLSHLSQPDPRLPVTSFTTELDAPPRIMELGKTLEALGLNALVAGPSVAAACDRRILLRLRWPRR